MTHNYVSPGEGQLIYFVVCYYVLSPPEPEAEGLCMCYHGMGLVPVPGTTVGPWPLGGGGVFVSFPGKKRTVQRY